MATSRSARLYAASPTLERGEDGNMGVKKPSVEPRHETARGDTPQGEQMATGTEGLPVHMRHHLERGELHRRHLHEHHQMHHRHQTEHAHHVHGGGTHSTLAAMHERHENERAELHTRHHAELVAMHERHEKERKADGGTTHERHGEKKPKPGEPPEGKE